MHAKFHSHQLLGSALFVACAAMLSALQPIGAYAQESLPRPGQVLGYSPTGITVTGHAEIKAQPDVARVTLTVETQSRDEAEAVKDNAAKMQAVMSVLQKSNVAQKDIHTSEYVVTPNRDYNANPPVLTGYTVQNSVDVTLRDIPKSGVILDKATAAGATVDNLSFDLSNKTHVQGEALVGAVADARANADLIAGAAGVGVGRLLSVTEEGASSPPIFRPMMARAMAAAAPAPPTQVSPQEITITADVTATYSIDYSAR